MTTVRPAFAVINPAAVVVCKELVPDDIVNPFVPVINPNTLSSEVVPVVPIFAVWPVATVNVLLNVDDDIDKSRNLVPPNEIPIFDAPIL